MPNKIDQALDHFLHESSRTRARVEIFLRGGNRFTGRIAAYDDYSILLDSYGVEYLFFKSAISRICKFKLPRGATNVDRKRPEQSAAVLPYPKTSQD